jgi:hypothetical protein
MMPPLLKESQSGGGSEFIRIVSAVRYHVLLFGSHIVSFPNITGQVIEFPVTWYDVIQPFLAHLDVSVFTFSTN